MFIAVVLVAANLLTFVDAGKLDLVSNSTVDLKMCGYSDTCSAGGYNGVCVSIGSGCCNGGTVTSGLCPGK